MKRLLSTIAACAFCASHAFVPHAVADDDLMGVYTLTPGIVDPSLGDPAQIEGFHNSGLANGYLDLDHVVVLADENRSSGLISAAQAINGHLQTVANAAEQITLITRVDQEPTDAFYDVLSVPENVRLVVLSEGFVVSQISSAIVQGAAIDTVSNVSFDWRKAAIAARDQFRTSGSDADALAWSGGVISVVSTYDDVVQYPTGWGADKIVKLQSGVLNAACSGGSWGIVMPLADGASHPAFRKLP